MRTLVVGSGAIGSVVAGRLGMTDADVTLLAHGERRAAVDARGVRLVDAMGRRRRALVPTVGHVDPDDRYDLVLVSVPAGRIDSVLPSLVANGSSAVMVWTNTFDQYPTWRAALGPRLLTGFPSFNARRDGEVVTITEPTGALALLRRTLVGDDAFGPRSDRLTAIARELARAGIRTHPSTTMEEWQRCHSAWIVPLAHVAYAAGGEHVELMRRPDLIALLTGSVREALAVTRTMSDVVDPTWLRLFTGSAGMAQHGLRMLLRSARMDGVLFEHAVAARPEMGFLLDQIRRTASDHGLPTDHLDGLGAVAGATA